MTTTTQQSSATHKDPRQEIEQHEKELKDLLNRVLKDPLDSAFGKFGSRLDVLEEAVDKLSNEGLPALMQSNEETSRGEFSGLKRFMKDEVNSRLDDLHEQLNPSGKPLGGVVVSQLTDALGTRLKGLEEAVDRLSNEVLPALMQSNEESYRKEFSGLKRLMEDEVNSRLDGLHEQLNPSGQPLGDVVVSKLTDVLGTRLEGLEKKLIQQMDASHQVLVQAQAAWQKSQEDRQQDLHGLQERVSAQLASVGKSLRVMQILTLILAAISAAGVAAVVVHLFL